MAHTGDPKSLNMAAAGRTGTATRITHFLPRTNTFKRVAGGFIRCSGRKGKEGETPQLLKIGVVGVTELLRLFSPAVKQRNVLVDSECSNEVSPSSVNDVLSVIESDYKKAYFVTGIFASAIYADDCTFEDPTIKFQGKELYARNLRLLVPFFDNPSIFLKEIEKGLDSEKDFIVASWRLRTYLKLPWKPLISIDGRTVYDLDKEFRIVRHVEKWSISALEATVQIFTPIFGRQDQ